MYTIIGIEWVTSTKEKYKINYLTQIAAVRVDKDWNTVSTFSSIIKLQSKDLFDRENIAFTGYALWDFMNARNLYDVLRDFRAWLNNDDILIWWSDDYQSVFNSIYRRFFKKSKPIKGMSIIKRLNVFLTGRYKTKSNLYRLASIQGIDVNYDLRHCSEYDVELLRNLLQTINFPQDSLEEPLPEETRQKIVRYDVKRDLPYQLDQSNIFHTSNCPKIINIPTIGYDTILTAIRKKFTPCECCKDEYYNLLKQKNEEIIEKQGFNYIFSPTSNVFHTKTCRIVHKLDRIMGTKTYSSASKKRSPCKICNPTKVDELVMKKDFNIEDPKKSKSNRFKTKERLGIENYKAVSRHKVATEDRKRLLSDSTLNEQQIKDAYTLTQPRFSFWASKGNKTFHTRQCHVLKNLSNLMGFSTYEDAVKAGYTPCRHCSPSKKHDSKFSIPITSSENKNNSIDTFLEKCVDNKYEVQVSEKIIVVTTPVSKWKINARKVPIEVQHINLKKFPYSKKYHVQPRLFLSLSDCFAYIKRHDSILMAENTPKRKKRFKSLKQPW